MTILRFLIVFAVLLLLVTEISCNANEAESEIQQLKSKIASLESTCLDQEKEIKEKGKRQFDLESDIQENSAQIASLSNEIDLLQKNDNSDDDELISKANAHHYMLQKQIEMLEKELETHVQKREALEAKASEAEKTAQKLGQKLECVEKINDDQKRKIEEISRDLQNMQEELSIARGKAKTKAKELQEIYESWLPHWLATHIEPLKNKIIYKVRKYSSYMEPHMQIATSKTSDVYEVCVDAITPHYVKAKQGFETYLHEMMKLFQPYIARVKMATQPYVAKLHLVCKPYKERVFGPMNMYHHKFRVTIYENLKKHELLKTIATEKIAWILASAIVCIPFILFYRLGISIFSKKRNSRQNSGGHHASHKHKRRHIDK